ncbi:MAG: GIY-YIG nuclease family protein [Saprospiraceae bacterium]|nr:GIY-YIG nuclease family protein [Saprospiraceae bacterium]
MPFFVYIIVSLQNCTFYKGFSLNPVLRLKQHNDGLSKYTSKLNLGNWFMLSSFLPSLML